MKNFGFGCMRLPMDGKEVNTVELKKMIDIFIENGFTYFDTAHGYHDGKSETAIRECLVDRYPRDKYTLTNKLSSPFFNTYEEIRPLFQKQLEICGVEYFDYYLMHSQNASIFEKYKKCRAYETALELKAEGKIRHFGISFHDRAFVLEQILSEYPQIELVQIQFNYADYEDPAIESRKCYEVCRKFNKPVVVMEPVRGGALVDLPEEAGYVFKSLNAGSPASYAIRFAASFEGVMMVLSGMNSVEQVTENVGFMKDFVPLSAKEKAAVDKVGEIFHSLNLISCTACRYCTEGCPADIPIPDLFACMNKMNTFHNWNSTYYYTEVLTKNGGKASDCVKCGQCEDICPQHLKIRDLLENVANTFEKNQ